MLAATDEGERKPRPRTGVRDHHIAAKKDPQPYDAMALLAHELRNPLSAIRMALQTLRQGHDAGRRQDVENLVERQSRHMSRLIDAALDVSRIGRGKVKPDKRRVQLADLVEVAIETVRPCIEERGHELRVALVPHVIMLDADPTRLTEVLTNLLENAAKFTRPAGRIELAAEDEGNVIVVRVRDSGVGIAPEMLPHVFDLFWQSPAADQPRGLGIGLTLVRQLVEMHGGSISASSAGLGEGSEFVVRLPRTTSTE
jgi:signal transduction histidine kinase